MSLKIETTSPKPRVTHLSLEGRLDTNTTPQLQSALDGVLAGDTRSLVYDLAKLAYVSSAGIRALFRSSKEMEKKGGHIAMLQVQPQVQKVFDIVQALPKESIFSSWDEVDAYLDKMQKRVLEGDL